jgi:ATP cone domain/Restriction endonuclease
MAVNVIKFNGEIEPFSEEKAYNSAIRAGASNDLARQVVRKINVYNGIRTSEISEKIRKALKKENGKAAVRFNLKKAINKLGPTGFPFEKYTAEIFSFQGFKTKTNLFIKGRCCAHETDFVAEKDNLLYIVECKYRNLAGSKVESKDAFANYARFLDIVAGKHFNKLNIKSMLVTNNKFTSEAIKYSNCVGVQLLGWRYPKDEGLEYLIEKDKLYPITILPSFKNYMFEAFYSKGIMMAKDVLEAKISLPQKNMQSLIKEAELIYKD